MYSLDSVTSAFDSSFIMFALCDVSSMYASCEKVFDPNIRQKPVVVLTNNDGCVCAVCPIAKKLGITKMFSPYYQVRDQLADIGAVIRSSNYELYADLSERMMDVCAKFAPHIHVYSIDECFLSYGQISKFKTREDWHEQGVAIRRSVWRQVRLPIGVGIAATTTLAKAANFAAKRIPGFNGVAVILSRADRHKILSQMKVSDVWGVGHRLSKQLNQYGILTAWQLANAERGWIRKKFSILLESTVDELNGVVKFSIDEVRSAKREIYSTRSFGQRIMSKVQLRNALAFHAQIAAVKLRKQRSLVSSMSIFAASSPHDSRGYYRKSIQHTFITPTNDSCKILAACRYHLDSIYREGIQFYRCGVGLYDLCDQESFQYDLFSVTDDKTDMMKCLDKINEKFGRDSVFIASRAIEQKFAMKREYLSPQYTTKITDVPKVYCH